MAPPPGAPPTPAAPAQDAATVALAQDKLAAMASGMGGGDTGEEEDFYDGKTQAMELKPAIKNADGTYTCAYCSTPLPPDVKATCPKCNNIVIGL